MKNGFHVTRREKNGRASGWEYRGQDFVKIAIACNEPGVFVAVVRVGAFSRTSEFESLRVAMRQSLLLAAAAVRDAFGAVIADLEKTA